MGKKKQEKQEKKKQEKQKDKLKKQEKFEKQQKKQKKPDRAEKEKNPKKRADRDHSDRIGSTYLRPEFRRRDVEDIDVQVMLESHEGDAPESARTEAHAEHRPGTARTEVRAEHVKKQMHAEHAKGQARTEKRRMISAEKAATAAPGGDAPRRISVAAEIFRALGDENRLRILALLGDGELCAGDLLKSLSIVQSTLSHHMKILVESGIVKCRRQGKWSYYSVDRGTMENVDSLMRQLAPEEQPAEDR